MSADSAHVHAAVLSAVDNLVVQLRDASGRIVAPIAESVDRWSAHHLLKAFPRRGRRFAMIEGDTSDTRRGVVVAAGLRPVDAAIGNDGPLVALMPFDQRRREQCSATLMLVQDERHGARLYLDPRNDDGEIHRPRARDALEVLREQLTALPAPMEPSADASFAHDVLHQPDARMHALAVDRALQAFNANALHKVVLARRSTAFRTHVDPLVVLHELLRLEPLATAYLFDDVAAATWVGATPEWLCRRRDQRVEIDVLAGTRARTDTRALTSDKNTHENDAVLTYVTEKLRVLGADIDVSAAFASKKLAHVEHLFRSVRASLPNTDSVAEAIHPTPAVLGHPVEAAQAFIAEHEPFAREQYAGAFGVCAADVEDMFVALRCCKVSRDRIDVYAGGGLVRGSVPVEEWQELEHKVASVWQAVVRAAR